MRKIVAYDFDGTLTTRDTLLAFILYAKGWPRFLWGFLRYAPLLVLMRLRLYPNYKAKQKVFAHFFGGMELTAFDVLCQDFAVNNRHLLRPEGVKTLEQAQAEAAKWKEMYEDLKQRALSAYQKQQEEIERLKEISN